MSDSQKNTLLQSLLLSIYIIPDFYLRFLYQAAKKRMIDIDIASFKTYAVFECCEW